MRPITASLLVSCLVLASSAARADLIYLSYLSGLEASPPTSSLGIGLFDIHLRPETSELFLHGLYWEKLEGELFEANLHCCNGPESPVAFRVVGFEPATSGAFSRTWDLTQASSFEPAYLAAYAGNVEAARDALRFGVDGVYVEFLTSAHPQGELGGVLFAFIPEPGTGTLSSLGLTTLAWLRRRDRG